MLINACFSLPSSFITQQIEIRQALCVSREFACKTAIYFFSRECVGGFLESFNPANFNPRTSYGLRLLSHTGLSDNNHSSTARALLSSSEEEELSLANFLLWLSSFMYTPAFRWSFPSIWKKRKPWTLSMRDFVLGRRGQISQVSAINKAT